LRRRAVLGLNFGAFSLAFFQGTPKTIELGAGLDYVGAASDAVGQGFTLAVIGNHRSPFREWQVSGDNHGGLLGAFGDDLEQESGNDLAKGT